MGILRLISALYLTCTKNKILLLDPPPNENSDVSFAPHRTTKNTTTFLAFTKNSYLKWEEILKIDRLKSPKNFVSNDMKRMKRMKEKNEKKLKSFLKSNLINFRTHKKSWGYLK